MSTHEDDYMLVMGPATEMTRKLNKDYYIDADLMLRGISYATEKMLG